MLEEVATQEKAIDPGRDFQVYRDRWRMWVEAQQKTALVNVMISGTNLNSSRSGNRTNALDEVTVFIDMYGIGKAGEVLPIDEVASDRVDLLIAQVREGLTRLKDQDYLFPKDSEFGCVVDRNLDFTLTYYDQVNEQVTGQYAPARWSFPVYLPYIPTDNNNYVDLEELNISVKAEDLEQFALRFNYNP